MTARRDALATEIDALVREFCGDTHGEERRLIASKALRVCAEALAGPRGALP